MKIVLHQDECAPDARHAFNKDFMDLVGESIEDFIKTAEYSTSEDESDIRHTKGKYELSISADDPFWKLYEV